jgi:hypothetical protein
LVLRLELLQAVEAHDADCDEHTDGGEDDAERDVIEPRDQHHGLHRGRPCRGRSP